MPAITTTSPSSASATARVDRASPIGVDLDIEARSLEHVLDDRERLLGARIVGGHDRDVREIRCDLAHQRPLAAVAVAAGTEDDDHAPLPELTRRSQNRGERVGRVRVVDEHGERLALVDRLEATRDTSDVRDSLCDRVLVEIEQQPCSDGTEDVLDVEPAAEPCLDVDARGAKAAAVRGDLEILGPHLRSAVERERDERRAMQVLEVGGEPTAPLVADVDRRRRRRWTGEEPPLGGEVLVHRPVQVEMILAEVREDERVEADAVEPSERRTVRARLDRGAAVAHVEHLAEQPLQVDRLGRGERGRTRLATHVPLDGADEPGSPAGGLEDRAQEKRASSSSRSSR